MDQKQKATNTLPKISIFDKKGQNQFGGFNKNQSNFGHGQTRGGAPQFRINQHKGA